MDKCKEFRGQVRRYVLKTADGPIRFVFCDHCALTTTRWTLAEGDPVNEPCMECGWEVEPATEEGVEPHPDDPCLEDTHLEGWLKESREAAEERGD